MRLASGFRAFAALALVVVVTAAPSAARAHFDLLQPPPADNASDGGKGAPPCGPTSPSNVVTSVQGGHALAISLTETVMHPGHYRFALSINSRSELPPDPAVDVSNGLSVSAASESPAVFPVLADDVFDHTTGTAPLSWQTSIVLPNVTCAKCTLQVIEFMAEHTSNPGGGYFYHHCADLKITADPSMPPFDAGVSDGGRDANTSGSGGGGGAGGALNSAATPGGSGGSSTQAGAGGIVGARGSSSAATAGASGTERDAGTSPGGPKPGSGGCSITDVGGSGIAMWLLLGALLAEWRRRRRLQAIGKRR